MKTQLNKYIAVTGTGLLTALGNMDETIAGMKNGIRKYAYSKRYTCPPFHEYNVFESDFVPHDDCADFSRTVAILFHCFSETMESAQLTIEDIKNMRVGVFVGTSEGTSIDIMDTYRKIRSGENEFGKEDDRSLQKYLSSNPALALAFYLRDKGVTVTFTQNVTNACSSGADAIGMGYLALMQDECDIVIAGGTDSFTANTFAGFISLLNADKAPCRPFDKTRGGLNLGEGAGIVIMEKPDARVSKSAEKGRVLGYGTSTDAYHLTAPSPEGAGLAIALDTALNMASKKHDDIAFINTHGTGTETNDLTELYIINEKFRDDMLFVATKGYTGHTLGAAGAVEAIITLAHLKEGILPASAGFSEPADGFANNSPIKEMTRISGNTALSFSLAFGGNNSVLVLGV